MKVTFFPAPADVSGTRSAGAFFLEGMDIGRRVSFTDQTRFFKLRTQFWKTWQIRLSKDIDTATSKYKTLNRVEICRDHYPEVPKKLPTLYRWPNRKRLWVDSTLTLSRAKGAERIAGAFRLEKTVMKPWGCTWRWKGKLLRISDIF